MSEGENTDRAVSVIDGGFIVLDTRLTPALRAEGTARDMIRVIQQARKDAGLQVSDRIRTVVRDADEVLDALRENERLVSGETLTQDLVLETSSESSVTVETVPTESAESDA